MGSDLGFYMIVNEMFFVQLQFLVSKNVISIFIWGHGRKTD